MPGPEDEGFGMHWYELTGTRHWQIEIQDVLVNDESVFSGSTYRAILDTGTSFITVPVSDFQSIIKVFSQRHSRTFGCEQGNSICYLVGKSVSL